MVLWRELTNACVNWSDRKLSNVAICEIFIRKCILTRVYCQISRGDCRNVKRSTNRTFCAWVDNGIYCKTENSWWCNLLRKNLVDFDRVCSIVCVTDVSITLKTNKAATIINHIEIRGQIDADTIFWINNCNFAHGYSVISWYCVNTRVICWKNTINCTITL